MVLIIAIDYYYCCLMNTFNTERCDDPSFFHLLLFHFYLREPSPPPLAFSLLCMRVCAGDGTLTYPHALLFFFDDIDGTIPRNTSNNTAANSAIL